MPVSRSRSSPWSSGLGQQARRAATSSTAPAPSDGIRVYQPSTRPGAPLPHAWIDDEDGRRPVKDLVASGRFLLIAGEDGQAWCEAARQLAAEADIPLDAVRIGHLDGDCHDPRCAWLRYPADRQRRRGPGAPGPVHRLAAPGRRQGPPGRPHRRAQPDPWAQTVCSARACRFLTGAGTAQR